MALDLEPYWLVHGAGPTNHRHGTRASAIREAERLARENPGQAFVVLEAVEALRLVEFERLTFGEPSEVSPDRCRAAAPVASPTTSPSEERPVKIQTHLAGFVRGPGLYQMPADAYHADCAPEPSLSSSIARLLIEQSPQHAWIAHPRLGCRVEPDRDPSRPKEIGTVAHKLILGRGAEVVAIDVDDYRTAAAKAQRAQAYAEGHCPILRPDAEKADALADQVTEKLAAIPGCEGFAKAPSEVVAVAQDRSGAWLRIMMDRVEIHSTHAIIWDVKTGDQSAAPQGLGRRVENMQMEIQAALYTRVLASLLPRLAGRIRFRWIFVENEFPHALTVAEADGAGMEIGSRKVAAAIHLWNRCRAADSWPGYPAEIVRFDYPEWAARRWTEREELDPQLAGVSYDIAKSPFRPLDMGDAA